MVLGNFGLKQRIIWGPIMGVILRSKRKSLFGRRKKIRTRFRILGFFAQDMDKNVI